MENRNFNFLYPTAKDFREELKNMENKKNEYIKNNQKIDGFNPCFFRFPSNQELNENEDMKKVWEMIKNEKILRVITDNEEEHVGKFIGLDNQNILLEITDSNCKPQTIFIDLNFIYEVYEVEKPETNA